jgi:AraC-like DNA-binding protein
MENEEIAKSKWSHELLHRDTLQIAASTTMPPPMRGNASILVGIIPEFLGVRDPTVAAISFLKEGNPLVERRNGSTIIQQRVRPPSFCITPAGTGYEYRTSDPHTSLNIAVTSTALEEFASQEMGKSQSDVRLKERLNCQSPVEMINLFQAFYHLVRSPRKGSRLYFETLWTQIALQLLWHHSSITEAQHTNDTAALSSKRMSIVISYLQENLGLDTSLSELAALVHLSPGHFLRAFKKATGTSPGQYRMNLRLKQACHLLRDSSLTITEIAMTLGFSSTSHFSMTFGRKMGKSPTLFRSESLNKTDVDTSGYLDASIF